MSQPRDRASARWRRAMRPRDRHEPHRVATPLELLFDLCFVVAVASAAARLHHALAEQHYLAGTAAYLMVFFAIWWAWMNFTWFASAYDTDDVPYRLTTFVQIAGVLILAAGVPAAFDRQSFTGIWLGYVVMRLGMAAQWLRAAGAEPAGRQPALRYAAGILACQIGWTGLLIFPAPWRTVVFVVMALAELAVPIWAERDRTTPWHPHHIAERYALFTIIVLGESVLSTTVAVQSGLALGASRPGLAAVGLVGLSLVFTMWWVYFSRPAHRFLTSNRVSFPWGYGHLIVFSSAAAVGAGLAVVVDTVAGGTHLSLATATGCVAAPAAIYFASVWLLHLRPHRRVPSPEDA